MEQCELRISEGGLHHNIRLVRRVAAGAQVIGVIKGNGYGLGLLELAGHLVDHGVRRLAVSEPEEALTLRNYGVPAEVMLLTPLYDSGDVEAAIQNQIILCIASRGSARAAQQVCEKLDTQARVQLCIDTGFGRYGFDWREMQRVWETVRENAALRVVGTYSHLSRSAAAEDSFSMEQLRRFTSACETLKEAGVAPGLRHLADSYAMLRHPELRLDAVRVGSAFLGRLPFPDRWGFARIGALSAPIREVRTLAPGSTVGYGGAVVTEKETRIGVIGAGYSHGFGLEREKKVSGGLRAALRTLRTPKNVPPLQVRSGERRLNVLGPVGMCATVVDITDTPLRVGNRVEVAVNPLFVPPQVERRYVP